MIFVNSVTYWRRRICRSTASRSPVLTRGGICVPPTVTYLPYRVSDSTLVIGRFRLLARWPGTHSRILSGIQRAAQTVLGVYLKRTCSRVTSASSALAVPNDCALYKSTHSLTHSLTHSRDVMLTCAQKPTWVSLIYGTEPTTKKWKTEKLRSKKRICLEVSVNGPGNPWSQSWRLRWEGFAGKKVWNLEWMSEVDGMRSRTTHRERKCAENYTKRHNIFIFLVGL